MATRIRPGFHISGVIDAWVWLFAGAFLLGIGIYLLIVDKFNFILLIIALLGLNAFVNCVLYLRQHYHQRRVVHIDVFPPGRKLR